jgi:DNA invertase Pin-like site-specific DNA recombinase
MPVFSYIRFSTPEQAMGDSERRQLADAKAWAARKGYELDESLRLTDRGLSGYHGDHRRKGSLGTFLSAVESGAVPAGSILLVENIDRLSREGFVKTLRQIVFKLWDRGITLQTLSPEETYEPGCDNNPKFIALFIYLQRARDESARKSERVGKAREQERREARESKRITGPVPKWLKPIYRVIGKRKEMERVEPIPEAAEAIGMAFDWKFKGLGGEVITQKLNEGPYWKPPKNPKAKTEG